MELEHSFTIPVPVEQAWPVLLDIRQIAPCMPGAAVDSVDGDDFTGSVKVKLGPINLTYKGQASFIDKDESVHKAVIDARGRDSRGNGTASAKITAQLHGKGEQTEVKVVTDLNITGKPAQFGRGVMVDVGNKLIGQFADCLAGKLAADNSGAAEKPPAAGSDATPLPAAAATATSSTTSSTTTAAGASGTGEAETPHAKLAGFTDNEDATKPAADAPRESAQSAADKQAAASSAPATSPRPAQKPAEPEPIDLIELAGGTVLKKAAPVALGAILLALIIALVVRKKS